VGEEVIRSAVRLVVEEGLVDTPKGEAAEFEVFRYDLVRVTEGQARPDSLGL
jgi:hypothetical protein